MQGRVRAGRLCTDRNHSSKVIQATLCLSHPKTRSGLVVARAITSRKSLNAELAGWVSSLWAISSPSSTTSATYVYVTTKCYYITKCWCLTKKIKIIIIISVILQCYPCFCSICLNAWKSGVKKFLWKINISNWIGLRTQIPYIFQIDALQSVLWPWPQSEKSDLLHA